VIVGFHTKELFTSNKGCGYFEALVLLNFYGESYRQNNYENNFQAMLISVHNIAWANTCIRQAVTRHAWGIDTLPNIKCFA